MVFVVEKVNCMKKKRDRIVKLRVCASCEWIFDYDENKSFNCPLCEFGSYNAHYVYGKKAYRFKYSQKPYKDKKMYDYEFKLDCLIKKNNKFLIEKARNSLDGITKRFL